MKNHRRHRQRGSALLTSFGIMMLVIVAALSVVNSGAGRVRETSRELFDVQGTELCEGGTQNLLLSLWLPFETSQTFTALDAECLSATEAAPAAATSGTIDGKLSYASAVISYTVVDSYTRKFTIRTVGWNDLNGDGLPNNGEPQKVVDVSYTFELSRSQVFDYTYFINNYGWMEGFGQNDLIVNGDMRSNGDFNFLDGAPTVNGSAFAAANNLLSPAAPGTVNGIPVKWTNSQYATNEAHGGVNNQNRWRPAYNAATDGAYGSALYSQWENQVFDSNGQILNGQLVGSAIGDVNGLFSFTSPSENVSSTTTLTTTPTSQVVMPDLNNIGSATDAPNPNGSYAAQSKAYTDPLATYSDGTANPLYGQGAYLEVWNSALNNGQGAYQTLTTQGVVNGSAIAVGTSSHPIKVHGPVTVIQDLVITGNVSGQGTIYAGRNVMIDGSILYTNPPNFNVANPLSAQNQKADILGLAANGSVIMGDTSQFSYPYPLEFMTPPFTLGRYDNNGNWIPPFNATAIDYTGNKYYQSVLGDATIHSLASPVNQIDAVMYTNNLVGGDIGTGGSGLLLNGSVISKDESMVVWSLPMQENYDMRIRENSLTSTPLIDINLPRSPTVIRNSWQDLGFTFDSP